MSITDLNAKRTRNVIEVMAVSDLSGVIYYHWYLDGAWMNVTLSGRYVFSLAENMQGQIDCLDTNDEDFDYIANAPVAYPLRRTLMWVGVMDSDILHYRIEQKKESDDWLQIGRVKHTAEKFAYSFITARLNDLTTYSWRIVSVDAAGNDGLSKNLGTESIVGTPDAPAFSIGFNVGPKTVTISDN